MIASVLFACQPKIIHFSNSKASYNNYNTYSIINLKKGNEGVIIAKNEPSKIIESSIREAMALRNYTERSKPDLIVRYELIANQVSETMNNNNFNDPFGFPSNSRARTSKESALLIEIIDLNTKKTIWQASRDLIRYDRESKREEVLKETVKALFDTYLYKASSSAKDESLKIGK